MKFQIKLIDADYDKETGISKAVILTELGRFEGISKIHEEDKDIESNYCGCNYAESKAIEKYLNAKIRDLKAQKKGIQRVLNTLSNMKKYNANSLEARKMRRTFYELNKEIKEVNDRKENLIKRRFYDMQHRRERIESLTSRKEDKTND